MLQIARHPSQVTPFEKARGNVKDFGTKLQVAHLSKILARLQSPTEKLMARLTKLRFTMPNFIAIRSVTQLVVRDCRVTFHTHGGHMLYPDGSRIRVVAKGCVVFVLLNVMQPNFGRRGHM